MFAIASTALLTMVGVAVDISSIQSTKQYYQDLSDAAVLAAAVSGKDDRNELEDIAKQTVMGITNDAEMDVVLTITPDNAIQVVVSKPQKLWLMSALGSKVDISATAEAPPKTAVKMNVALVLDVTASMEGTKLDDLRAAATGLVEAFEEDEITSSKSFGGDGDDTDDGGEFGVLDDAGADIPEFDGGFMMQAVAAGTAYDPDDVKFSVVPFARYVRIPMELESEPWMFVEEPNDSCWNSLDLEASQAAGSCTNTGSESSPWVCTSPVYEEVCETVQWWGCVTSRVHPWNKRPQVGPLSIPGFAGGGSCMSELLPLTGDKDAVKNSIDNLYTGDETYIPSGLIWGWRTLTPDAPLEEANTIDYAERKSAMILMTDGENSRSYGGDKDNGFEGVFHWESNLSDSNDLTAEICEDIKADGIEIYSIAFEVTDAATQTMLRTCATDGSKYFDAADSDQLFAAFETIGDDLAAVRLSK